MIAVAQNRPKCPVPMERFSMWHFQTDLPTMIFSMMLSYHDARALYSFINRFNWSFMEKHINIKLKEKDFRDKNYTPANRTDVNVCNSRRLSFNFFLKTLFFEVTKPMSCFDSTTLCLHCLHYFTHFFILLFSITISIHFLILDWELFFTLTLKLFFAAINFLTTPSKDI